MALFKLSLKYAGRSSEDLVEIEADSPKEARLKCEKLVEENISAVERMAKLNVYTSKILESCSLCNYDYKLDMLSLEKVLNSSKNDI